MELLPFLFNKYTKKSFLAPGRKNLLSAQKIALPEKLLCPAYGYFSV